MREIVRLLSLASFPRRIHWCFKISAKITIFDENNMAAKNMAMKFFFSWTQDFNVNLNIPVGAPRKTGSEKWPQNFTKTILSKLTSVLENKSAKENPVSN